MTSTASSRSYSFSKRYRLSLQRDFRRVFRNGKRIESEWAVVLGSPNGLGHGRIGIVVGRRLGNAAERNRAKRRIREWFRRGPKDVPLDMVIMPRRPMTGMNLPLNFSDMLDNVLRQLTDQ